MDDLGDGGRKAMQEGQRIGITDRLFVDKSGTDKWSPEFSGKAIGCIKSNINKWISEIDTGMSEN